MEIVLLLWNFKPRPCSLHKPLSSLSAGLAFTLKYVMKSIWNGNTAHQGQVQSYFVWRPQWEPSVSCCKHSAEAAVLSHRESKDDSVVARSDPQTPNSKGIFTVCWATHRLHTHTQPYTHIHIRTLEHKRRHALDQQKLKLDIYFKHEERLQEPAK